MCLRSNNLIKAKRIICLFSKSALMRQSAVVARNLWRYAARVSRHRLLENRNQSVENVELEL